MNETATPTTGTTTADGKPDKRPLPDMMERSTRHTITLDGGELDYEATVGTIHIDTAKVKPAASVFFTAFNAVDPATGEVDPERPVTFVFNGGPGSSTTFLLTGSISPKRIDIPDAAPVPPAPYKLIDNEHTLLPVSDLVFVDAPGTGFSQILDEAKPELWSVDGDVKGFSAFIRAYLSKYHRWNSPKYLIGESYGTTRGAALALRLHADGVALNGITLISNILDYSHCMGLSDQFFIGYFPSYAAVGWYHKRAGLGVSLQEHVRAARAFANGPLRLALAAGASLDDGVKRDVAEHYAQLTGLKARYVYDSDLRVLDTRFRKALLHGEDRIVGRYDGRVAGYDLNRMHDEETFEVDDAWLDPAYFSLCNAYLRDELGWSDVPERKGFADIDWESDEPGKTWVWRHRWPANTPNIEGLTLQFPNVIPDLATAIVHHPTMKVLLGNGYYDLCTPFGQTEYDVDHLGLPKALRGNVAFTYYTAGHMLYTSPENLAKFTRDLTRFYAADVADLPAMNERVTVSPKVM